jgi:hypothetical protein
MADQPHRQSPRKWAFGDCCAGLHLARLGGPKNLFQLTFVVLTTLPLAAYLRRSKKPK